MNISQHTDAELMASVRTDDRKAFRELYNRYQEDMYQQAFRKVLVREVAEEIVQDVFVSLWEKRHKLLIGEIRNYLFRSVRNGVLDHVRAQIVRQKYAKEFVAVTDLSTNDTDDVLALYELNNAINAGMNSLSDKTREIFRYNRLEALSADEISRQLNLPKRTVEYHITLALRTMRETLKHFLPIWLVLIAG